MLVRLLPGFLIAFALGVFFCLPTKTAGGRRHHSSAGSQTEPLFFGAEPASMPEVRLESSSLTRHATSQSAAVPSRPNLLVAEKQDESESSTTREDILAMGAPSVIRKRAVPDREELFEGKAFLTAPTTLFSQRRGFASSSALASAGTDDIVARTPFPTPPDRGLRIWGGERYFSERQKARDLGLSAYSFDGNVHSAGIKKDWSVDSTLGLSLDYLDGELKSGHAADTRKDDISGYLVNAHYDGLLIYKYPFNLKFVYGRVENHTKGKVYYPGTPSIDAWEDEKHKSDIYGLSGNFAVPLIMSTGLKMLAEFGFDYRKLEGKAYRYRLNGTEIAVPKANATSLLLPMTLTVSKDYIHSWGLITPRFSLGMSLELDDSAMGVRTLNSNAASWVSSGSGIVRAIESDTAQQDFYQIGFGVDVKSVGGWEISAGFTRYAAEKYHQNEFKLELSRCF